MLSRNLGMVFFSIYYGKESIGMMNRHHDSKTHDLKK